MTEILLATQLLDIPQSCTSGTYCLKKNCEYQNQ